MKKKKKWIANKLKREYSVIKREIKKNSGCYLSYTAISSQRIANRRAGNINKRKLEKYENRKLKEYIKKELRNDNSPEQIAGRLKNHSPEEVKECQDKTISHESIYDYIYNGEGK